VDVGTSRGNLHGSCISATSRLSQTCLASARPASGRVRQHVPHTGKVQILSNLLGGSSARPASVDFGAIGRRDFPVDATPMPYG
jgi:hypothetical protein